MIDYKRKFKTGVAPHFFFRIFHADNIQGTCVYQSVLMLSLHGIKQTVSIALDSDGSQTDLEVLKPTDIEKDIYRSYMTYKNSNGNGSH